MHIMLHFKIIYHWRFDFIIDNENKRKPTEIDIINEVVDLWYDDNKITNELIIKSFKVTYISVNFDGSEDNLNISS